MGDQRGGAEHCIAAAGLTTSGADTAMPGLTVYQVSQARMRKQTYSATLSTHTAKHSYLPTLLTIASKTGKPKQPCATVRFPAQPNGHAKLLHAATSCSTAPKTGVLNSLMQHHRVATHNIRPAKHPGAPALFPAQPNRHARQPYSVTVCFTAPKHTG